MGARYFFTLACRNVWKLPTMDRRSFGRTAAERKEITLAFRAQPHQRELIPVLCRCSSLLSQGIEIIPFFLKQAVTNQSFDRIENRGARIRIVFTSFKQRMQIELLLAPKLKTANHTFFNFSHGEVSCNAELSDKPSLTVGVLPQSRLSDLTIGLLPQKRLIRPLLLHVRDH